MNYNQLQEATQALGFNPNTLKLTDPSMRDKAVKNPKFQMYKNTILKYTPPPETVELLEHFTDEAEANAESVISTLEARYNNLTTQLETLREDEKNAWLQLNNAKDSNFEKKREGYLIKQKLDKLKRERDLVFNTLSNQYNQLTQNKQNALQLQDRNTYVTNLQNEMNNDNKNKLVVVDRDILTRRRQVQINMNQYYKQNNKIYFLKVFFIFTLIAMIPIICGLLGLISKSIASTILLVVYIILALIFMIRVIDNSNRSKLLWQERIFKNQDNGDDSEDTCGTNDARNQDTCENSKYGCCPDGVTNKEFEDDTCNMNTETEEENINNQYSTYNNSNSNLFF